MITLKQGISLTSRRRLATGAVLVGPGLAAWVAVAGRMSGIDVGGGLTVGTLGFFVVLWVVMMAAMMFPSAWPAVATFGMVASHRVSTGASARGRSVSFVIGYLVSWTAFGLAAFAVLATARGAGLGDLSDAGLARYVVAPAALAAALYQVVPFKQACLRHCRGPLSFFVSHWRDGVTGALLMGARHGAFCLGCCWLLMGVLLAIGMMSLAWMAVVSSAIAIEKLAPPRWSTPASGLLAVWLVALSLVAFVEPSWLPGLGMGDGMPKR